MEIEGGWGMEVEARDGGWSRSGLWGREGGSPGGRQRPKGQKLHVGNVWLTSYMPDGKTFWEKHSCESDCVL